MILKTKISRDFLQKSLLLFCGIFAIASVSAKLVFVTEENAVNTNNFIINADDSSSDFVDLEFGSALGVKLRYDILANKFIANRDLDINGNLKLTESTPTLFFNDDGTEFFRWNNSTKLQFGMNGNLVADITRISSDSASFRPKQFSIGASADSNPAFSFQQDTNTGLYLEGLDKVGLATDGIGHLVVDALGNVGIGDVTPDAKLDVEGNVIISRDLLVEDSAVIHTNQTYTDSFLGNDLQWNLLQTTKTIDPNDKDFSTITSGNGWKDVLPLTRWKVGDEVNLGQHYGYVGYLPEKNKEFRINTGGGDSTDLVFGTQAKDIVHLKGDSGKVGIGTSAPDELLHIAGNMRLNGSFEDKDGESGTLGQILSSTATGTDWITNSSNPIPYITTTGIQSMQPSSTKIINFAGINFTPTSTVSIPGFDGTIDSTSILSPTSFEMSVTSGSNLASYDIVISNGGIDNTLWTGNGEDLLAVTNTDGTSQSSASESCKQILDDGFSTGDGNYWINPDGGDTSNAFEVYCDMTTDGGGWTQIAYSADFPHQAHFSDGDTSRWLDADFTLTLTDTQINDIRLVSTEGKQRYVGTCDGVIHYEYNSGYDYAFGFRYHDGHETAWEQQTYPSTNITIVADGCETNNDSSTDTIFDIVDIRVPVMNVHSRDNSSSEEFGSPLTSNPAWLR